MTRALLPIVLMLLWTGGDSVAQQSENSGGSQGAKEQKAHAGPWLNNDAIVKLVMAGFAEETIVNVVNTQPGTYSLGADDIIALKKAGVSEKIITAMLSRSAKPPSPPSRDSMATSQAKSDSQGVELLEAGVYYKGPKGWVKLSQATMAGGGTKHMGKMFVPGLTPQFVWTFRGSGAPVQIAELRPTFFVKQSPFVAGAHVLSGPEYSPPQPERNVVIVRFDKKKDHRELQTTSGSSMFTFKSGFSKERTPDITVTRISESVFSVAPAQDLSFGEYLLTFGGLGYSGYDFGIAPEK